MTNMVPIVCMLEKPSNKRPFLLIFSKICINHNTSPRYLLLCSFKEGRKEGRGKERKRDWDNLQLKVSLLIYLDRTWVQPCARGILITWWWLMLCAPWHLVEGLEIFIIGHCISHWEISMFLPHLVGSEQLYRLEIIDFELFISFSRNQIVWVIRN